MGKFRLVTTAPAVSIDHLFPLFRLMSEDHGNDPERGELIFLRPRHTEVLARTKLLAGKAMAVLISRESHDRHKSLRTFA
jgi:hypothetical protein